tara:strand:- start:1315 stop:1980 length:666 start_codon:yes stop_codon:yes gene_type:complete
MIVESSFRYEWDDLDFGLCGPETPTKERNRSASSFDDHAKLELSPKGISDMIVAEDEDYFSSFDDSFLLFPPSEMDLDVSFLPSTPRKHQHHASCCDESGHETPKSVNQKDEDDQYHSFQSFRPPFAEDTSFDMDSLLGMTQSNLYDQFDSVERESHDNIILKKDSTPKALKRHIIKNYKDEPKLKKSKVEKPQSKHCAKNAMNVHSRSAKLRANNTWKGK